MAGKRDKRRRQEARRRAHLDRLGGPAEQAAGEQRRERQRDEAARAAAIGPSAARWLVEDPRAEDAAGRPVDVVADLLALDPRTRLRGRGDAPLRALAAQAEGLVLLGATTPSGRALVEVLVADPEVRTALAPSLDLEALLSDGPLVDRSHDRTVRLAEAMLDRAAAHRAGAVDLHALVAPVGVGRHAAAAELETIVHVATEHVTLPPNPQPAVVVTTGGWVATSPVELFVAAARGLLAGTASDVGGAALYAWLDRIAHDPADPWWGGLTRFVEVDAGALVQQAAARAGSDHPDVAGGALVELVSLRHPLL